MDITAISAALPALQARALATLEGRKTCPVGAYLTLRTEAQALDLTTLEAARFRQRFNGYYGVRRNSAWRSCFYDLFERTKGLACGRAEAFDFVLDGLQAGQGRVEASFASKAICTLWPEGPVIDSVLRGFLKGFGPVPPIAGLDQAKGFYRSLEGWMGQLVDSEEARSWAQIFDDRFSDLEGAAGIHPMKKLDFLIWGGAAR